MLFLTGISAFFCIIIILICLKKFYTIPDADVIKKMIANTTIAEIEISTKFVKIRKINISNPKSSGIEKINCIREEEKKKIVIRKIKSNWIGTLSLISRQTGKPYIEIGQTVNPEDVVGHITAMNLDIEVTADFSGKIIEILFENNSTIDFGKTIMLAEEEI